MRACTIIAKNYLAYARVLARSFRAHHPDGEFTVLVIDDVEGYVDPADEPFEVIGLDSLDEPEIELMTARYDVLELSTAVKPWLLRTLLARGAEPVTYLDPDIEVFASLTRLDELARQHGLVLTPHNTEPIPFDGERPSQVDIMIAGVFNLGYVTLRPGDQAEQLLTWWSERLRRDCRVDPVYGYFVDQRWMDLVPGLVSDYAVVREPEFNVAYWNLHARQLEASNGGYVVNGRPLAFFHFSGFDPARPDILSRHQTRIDLRQRPALAALCRAYADALADAEHETCRRWPYSRDRLPDGTPFVPLLRRLFADGELRGALHDSPFSDAGCADFRRWIEGRDADAPPGVSRLLAQLYYDRPDVRAAFPSIAGADRIAFLRWARETGMAQVGLPAEFAPSPDLPATRAAGVAEPGRPVAPHPPLGVNVIFGRPADRQGQRARGPVLRALDEHEIPAVPLDGLDPDLAPAARAFAGDAGASGYPLNLWCLSHTSVAETADRLAPALFEGRYTIGLWCSEPAMAWPPTAGDALTRLDEVWVPSRYLAEMLAPVADVPVVVVAPAVAPVGARHWPRYRLALPERDFLFLTILDYSGGLERQQPLAVLEAFRNAFPESAGATLVIRVVGEAPAAHAQLLEAVREDPRVCVHDVPLSAEADLGLVDGCDAYVSLHRYTSFGLDLAEAMYLGKPVVATGYSGNLEFMTAANSYLVAYELVPVDGADGDRLAPVWAAPDIEHASGLMRELFENREGARERGARAAADLRVTHSPSVAAARMAERLQLAQARSTTEDRGAFRAQVPVLKDLQHRVARGRSDAPAGTRTRRAIRAVLLRLARPLTDYQFGVNERVLANLERLTIEFERERQQRLGHQAAWLRQLRAEGRARAGLQATLDGIGDRLAITDAEARAIPFMHGEPFQLREDPVAGRVMGYSGAGDAETAGAYRAFEDVFRGSEELIAERQARYLPLIEGRAPVLDIGCGRGELLDLLREAGVSYLGVDSDEGMVARCHEKGHAEVACADGIEYLDGVADASLGVVFAAQVIEHLPEAQLRRLIALARRKLAPGGLVVLETVNPYSPPALKTFWVDLTHQHPIFPEVALELCREAGFGSGYFFFPNGTRDVDRDRFIEGEYTVVATAARDPDGVRLPHDLQPVDRLSAD